LAQSVQRPPPPRALLLLHVCLLQPLPSIGHCLQSYYLATAIVWLLISWSLPSNGSACHNIYLLPPQPLYQRCHFHPENIAFVSWPGKMFSKSTWFCENNHIRIIYDCSLIIFKTQLHYSWFTVLKWKSEYVHELSSLQMLKLLRRK
jgi:hypothetical protein